MVQARRPLPNYSSLEAHSFINLSLRKAPLLQVQLETQSSLPQQNRHATRRKKRRSGRIVARFRDIDGNTFSLSVSTNDPCHGSARECHPAKLEAERRTAHELEIAKHVQCGGFPQVLPR